MNDLVLRDRASGAIVEDAVMTDLGLINDFYVTRFDIRGQTFFSRVPCIKGDKTALERRSAADKAMLEVFGYYLDDGT